MASSIVVDFGPPPSVSAIEKEEIQIRNTTAKIPGILDFNMGNSIRKKRFFLLKFKLSASLNCSVGIFCQPCNISLETSGRLVSDQDSNDQEISTVEEEELSALMGEKEDYKTEEDSSDDDWEE